jgi:hypothetical protein
LVMVERTLDWLQSGCKREAERELRMGRARERRRRVRWKKGRRRVQATEAEVAGSGYNMGQAAEGGTMRCQCSG